MNSYCTGHKGGKIQMFKKQKVYSSDFLCLFEGGTKLEIPSEITPYLKGYALLILLAYIALMLIGVCIRKGKIELNDQDLFGTMMTFPCSAHENPDHGRWTLLYTSLYSLSDPL